MAKSTRKNKPISSIITYQQRDVVKSLTVEGATDLVDFQDDNGHITITVSRDDSKVDTKDFDKTITELHKTITQLHMDMDTKATHETVITVQEFLQKQIDELKAQIN